MSDYTLAPAVSLVATDCAACSRPLLDAVSVEAGMGPTCRKRHGYGVAQRPADWAEVARAFATAATPERPSNTPSMLDGVDLDALWETDARRLANVLVARIAAQPGHHEVPALLMALSALGFVQVAGAIAGNLRPVVRVIRETAPGALPGTADQFVVEVARGTLPEGAFEAFVDALRCVPGRRWDRDRYANVVPAGRRRELWAAFKRALPAGTMIVGDRVAVLA